MKNLRNLLRIAILGLGMAAAVFANAQAVDTTGSAVVTVIPSLTITRNSDTNWGRVMVPASGTATYLLDYRTGATSLTAGNGFCFSDGNAGDYSITGLAGATVSYSVSVGSFSGSGLSIASMEINGHTNSGTDTLDGSGNLTLKLGGTLDVDSTATVAQQTAQITLSVNYQ